MRICILFWVLVAPVAAMATPNKLPKDFDPPTISLQQAVDKAQHCLAEKKMKPDGYLQSAVFSPARQANQIGPDRGRHWIMKWQRPGLVLGGEVIPIIYEDGSCVVTFGE